MTNEWAAAAPEILWVEDDRQTVAYVTGSAHLAHIAITVAEDGQRGRALALAGGWDCIILDRRLPGGDGLAILADLRAMGMLVPVLVLTTMDGIQDRVTGLRRGADDYLVKPFSIRELSARLDVLMRRLRPPSRAMRLIFADIEVDLVARQAYRAGKKLFIQDQELKLLEYFMRHPNIVLSHEMLLQAVWDIDFPIRTNLLESNVSRLRDRLGRDAPPLIHTVRGQGYMLRGQ
ncbi:response regulator transcription factor [Gluconacetobacter asukensis]|uniref:Response regulator transcription factor n=1 Tax=Gluconacetobacter asukensis TaxID=1017181 RepID=A0A7W4J1W0_9PROT|nr:response regulator transcription factor [Gluconacetobacter asukensis]MBB2172967.1 response regulator transcription factor [Gluconacetobacter asukensis]